MSKAKAGDGDVAVVLDGETYYLRPSIKAMRVCSRLAGGIRPAQERILNLDFDLIVKIIEAGLSEDDRRAIGNVEAAAFRAGFTDDSEGNLAYCTSLFTGVLMNGGRMPPDMANVDALAADDENPQDEEDASGSDRPPAPARRRAPSSR